MKLTKLLPYICLFSFGSLAFAKGPGFLKNLSDEDRTCLESQLGTPDSGNRPTREAMDSALEYCKIDVSEFKPPKHHQNLSETDRQCLDEKLGSPEERTERPTREEMHAAMSDCNIEVPKFRERQAPPQHQQNSDQASASGAIN